MIHLELSETEARILAILLKGAGDEFSNHGCNDFDVSCELAIDKTEATKVAAELMKAMNSVRVADAIQVAEHSGTYLYDWQLYRYFEKRVREALK